MATIKFSLTTATARSSALLSAVGSGATLTLYSGPIPASPDISPTGSLLVSVTLPSPFGVVSDGQLIANPIQQAIALQTGQAGYGRIINSAGDAVCDLDVGIAGSGAAIIINQIILSAAPVIVASLTISEA